MGENVPVYKIVLFGSSSVGKSSIVQRLITSKFSVEGVTTCGADFYAYQCNAGGQTVKLQIWDTAGQERFRTITKSYFRNAVGAILVFDISDKDSFEACAEWLEQLEQIAPPGCYCLLVGNKVDLEKDRQVSQSHVAAFADRHGLHWMETSAATGKNIKEAFARLATEVSRKIAKRELVPRGPAAVALRAAPPAPAQGGCC